MSATNVTELTSADVDEIRNLICEYSFLIDAYELDLERFRELWAADAVFDLERDVYGFGTPLVGVDAIMGRLGSYLAKDHANEFTRHLSANHRVELIHGQAIAQSTLLSVRYDLSDESGAARLSRTGVYRDRFVHERGRWRFAKRLLGWDPPARGSGSVLDPVG